MSITNPPEEPHRSLRDPDLQKRAHDLTMVSAGVHLEIERGNAGSPSDGTPSKLCATLASSR